MDLEDHFAEKNPTNEVREACHALAEAQLPNGMDVWKDSRYSYDSMKCELRFGIESKNISFYRAVLNKNSVRWCFREPALNQKLFDRISTLRHFQRAKGERLDREITLKLYNAKDARDVLSWINGRWLRCFAANRIAVNPLDRVSGC